MNLIRKMRRIVGTGRYNSEEYDALMRYSFDNLLIGRAEAEIAHEAIDKDAETLLRGNTLDEYHEGLADCLGVTKDDILLFYTAHGALSFLLKQLRERTPQRTEVVVAGFTCSVVVNAVVAADLKPIFADIESDTYGVDVVDLKRILTEKHDSILAVVMQHLFGNVTRDYDATIDLCRQYGVVVIGDCAQALGTRYKGKQVGLSEDYAIFSSQASKSLNTYTGGALLSNTDSTDLQKAYEQVDYPDPDHVRRILNAYYIQYQRKVRPGWMLRYFMATNRKAFIPSMHPSEIEHNTKRTLQAQVARNATVYVRRFPGILAGLGILQLSRLQDFTEARRVGEEYVKGTFGAEPFVTEGAEPVFLRVPVMKDEAYKTGYDYDRKCLVGKWFPYYYGDGVAAERAARQLVNYVPIDSFVVRC